MSSLPPSGLASSPLQASFQRSYRQLVQFLTRKTGCAEDARELTQDLWLQLQRRGAEPAAEDPQAYLFAMARNLAIDHLRRRQLADEHARSWLALHQQEPAALDGARLLAQRRMLQAVAATLQALAPRTREVFVDHRVHGIGQDALALRHGVTRSTIERDVQRGAAAVQAVLERWHGDAGTTAGRRRGLGALLGLATLAGGGLLGWQWWRAQAVHWQAQLASAVGRQLQQRLPDGSRITLDAASQARVAYDAAFRRVALARGAAFFEVVHEPGRPFVVEAAHLRVTVLGTRFSVDIQGEVEVGVESGRVRVEPLDAAWPPVELGPGELQRFAAGRAPAALQRRASGQLAPWRSGWLGFRDAPLGQVLQRLQRYTGSAIEADAAAAALPVTAEIRIAQAADWLAALPRAMPVRVLREAGRTVVTRR